ncbi:hypothetical protein FMM06_09150 [Glacieibacterium frigidum]|uniref:DUF6456 domain-containing protein n=2 Tax=Glacieibacterium frigidum TaxID=2593303 RepID=A0A552UJW4_9SPHN|nr:DUF6456 domain-containing protein [Glacieibacterium frigidum]TRW18480.1 hypothetical protein FMM06_09150 [Glacieibacterium frigidum]
MSRRNLLPSDRIDRRQVSVNLSESPLYWLARRGLLSAIQLAAGVRLREDFHRAGHTPQVSMRWNVAPPQLGPRGAPPAYDPGLAALSARERFDAAVAAAGPGLSDILWRVVCMGEGLESAERALAWPARAAKLVLGLALDRVATFYGLK